MKAIAMGHKELFISKLNGIRSFMNDHSYFFFQIPKSPDIMISYKEVDFNPGIGQFGQLAQEPYIPFGYYSTVFEPEIEHIPQQINSSCIVSDTLKPVDHFLFVFPWVFYKK